MEGLFISILNMSVTFLMIIAVVIIIRLLFRRAPKAFFCALWAFVGFRLICPFTLPSVFSIMPDSQPVIEEIFTQESVSVNPEPLMPENDPPHVQIPDSKEPSLPQITDNTPSEIPQENPENRKQQQKETADSYTAENKEPETVPAETVQTPLVNILTNLLHTAPYIWASVTAIMFLSALIQFLLMSARFRAIKPDENGICYCDGIDSPFIFGIFSPKIFLPAGTKDSDKEFILDHERAHLQRLDHLWKPIGFAVLCLHWFNPLVWVAFHLFCKDIELACDELVIQNYSFERRKEYSHTLVNYIEQKKKAHYIMLHFGESGVKERVIKESLNKSRLTAQHSSRLHLFRHLAPNSLENRQVSCAHLIQSDEKSDCAI